jgi:hypothetical protein
MAKNNRWRNYEIMLSAQMVNVEDILRTKSQLDVKTQKTSPLIEQEISCFYFRRHTSKSYHCFYVLNVYFRLQNVSLSETFNQTIPLSFFLPSLSTDDI